jgi:hypothetical protein
MGGGRIRINLVHSEERIRIVTVVYRGKISEKL